jgi:ABC-type molybdate transport system permease subunit
MEKWVYAFRFVGIGWYIAICIGGSILGGLWLDRRFGTSIIFTLAGVFLGLVVAALGTYRMIEPLIREQNDTTPGDRH